MTDVELPESLLPVQEWFCYRCGATMYDPDETCECDPHVEGRYPMDEWGLYSERWDEMVRYPPNWALLTDDRTRIQIRTSARKERQFVVEDCNSERAHPIREL